MFDTKNIICVHHDIVTVPEKIKEMEKKYRSEGYDTEFIGSMVLQLKLDDGKVLIYWENGAFYQEIVQN